MSESTLVKTLHCWKSHVVAHFSCGQKDRSYVHQLFISYMSAHVLLNLLSELGKSGKMQGLLSIFSLFRKEFNKFKNTGA